MSTRATGLRSAARDRRAATRFCATTGPEPSSATDDPLSQGAVDALNCLPAGFVLFDKDERAVIVNSVFKDMLPSAAAMLLGGATFPEMARHNALASFNIGNEDIDAWMQRRLAYRDKPKGAFDQKLNDGRWVRIQEGRTTDGGTVTNWTDITDLKKQEKAINDYAVALANTNAELQEFAHVASHDLQEPLRKIEAFGSRLADSCSDKLDEREARYLERMQDASSRMRAMVSDLLDYARVQNNTDAFGPVDLNTVVIQALENLELTIEDRQARVTFADLPTVNGDTGELTRLFQNLISNSLKYCPDERAPQIQIGAAEVEDDLAVVTVIDNGIGFESEYAEKIFNVFQRLHNRSQYQGSGIGLASCRKIVQGHGGHIRAEGRPDAGSTFTIALPFAS